jgi:olefin beta-lactone synthetase
VVTRSYDQLADATARAKIVAADGTLWHRMGDAGYLDDAGRLWFCGRVVERVLTANGPLYTDCCEAIVNRQPGVYRSALIGLGTDPHQTPAIVIEPQAGARPDLPAIRAVLADHPLTTSIRHLMVRRALPVDVRHNAKIHRLTLARQYAKTPLRP